MAQNIQLFGPREGFLTHQWIITWKKNKSQINTMMKQRWGLDRNVLRPTSGDPWVSNNTTGTLEQKKTNSWTPVGQATDKKAPTQTLWDEVATGICMSLDLIKQTLTFQRLSRIFSLRKCLYDHTNCENQHSDRKSDIHSSYIILKYQEEN